jgi:type II secretory pathway predicted ATPase ExeA
VGLEPASSRSLSEQVTSLAMNGADTAARSQRTFFGVADPQEYLACYGLKASPFRPLPDPDLLWMGAHHKAILAALATAVRTGNGIALLTGEVGTGKTSLGSALALTVRSEGFFVGTVSDPVTDHRDSLDPVAHAAYARDRVHRTMIDLVGGLDQSPRGTPDSRLKRRLLIIDDAQSASTELLQEIWDLASAERQLAILLVGQKDLHAALDDDWPEDWRRHVLADVTIDPLTASEVGSYVRYRLALAGTEHEIFTADAVEAIASISRGAPGVINVVADRALQFGLGRQAQIIDRAIIEDCLEPAEALRHSERATESFGDAPRRANQAAEIRRRRQRSADRTVKSLFSRTRILPAVLLATGILIAGYVFGVGRMSPIRSDTSAPQSGAVPPVSRAPRAERGDVKPVDKMTLAPVPTDIAGATQPSATLPAAAKAEESTAPAQPGGTLPVAPKPQASAASSGRAGADGTGAVKTRSARLESKAAPRSAPAGPRVTAPAARVIGPEETATQNRGGQSEARRPTQKDGAAPDPSEIIDWLLKEGSQRR